MSRSDRAKEAADAVAADIATRAEPGIARAMTGGKSDRVDSETSHRIAAAFARDMEKGPGAIRKMSEYAKEARRK